MKSTFHYRQELRSTEFGTLLYDILPSGIYRNPSLTSSGGHIVMTGGTFLLKDNTDNMNFIIRVSYDDSERVESIDTIPGTLPAYIYLEFTYNPAMEVEPSLRVQQSLPSGTEYILLGRLMANNVIDTTTNDRRGGGYSYPNPIISSLVYNVNASGLEGSLDVTFNGYCQNNSTLSLIPNFHQDSVLVSQGYALYIDQNGNPALMDYDSSGSFPSMGRTLLAYKDRNSNLFTVQNFVGHAEITADSLRLPSATLTANEAILDAIYTDPSTTNSQGAILSKVIQRLVTEVQALRDELNTLRADHNSLDTKVANMSNDFSTVNLKVSGSANFTGSNVDFSNGTLIFTNTDFGTDKQPLSSLYVENVLYATKLEYFSN